MSNSRNLSKADIKALGDYVLGQIENKEVGYSVRAKMNANFYNLKQDVASRATKDDVDKLKLRYYETEAALKADQSSPNIGDRALVGVPYPGTVWGCKTKGVWYNTGVAPTPEELDLADYAKNGGSDKTAQDLDNENNTYNVTMLHPLSTGQYYTLDTAIAAIPTSSRKAGLYITYRIDANNWEEAQYKLPNVTDAYWNSNSNWLTPFKNLEKRVNEKIDVTDFVNVTALVPLPANQYYTLNTAIAALPTNFRRSGLTITYRIDANNWESWQYRVPNITDVYWLNSSYWISRGGGNVESEVFYNMPFSKGGYYTLAGLFVDSTNNSNTGLQFIKGFDKITFVAGNLNSASVATALFFDEKMNIIKSYGQNDAGNEITLLPDDIPNAVFAVFSSANTLTSKKVVLVNPYSVLFGGLISLGNKKVLEGLIILYLGTSIPAGSSANITGTNIRNAYPNVMADILGFTVYNEAIPTSCVKRGRFSQVTESDPYGMTGMNWNRLSLGLSWTQAEMQDLFDNWSTWQPLIAGAPIELTDAIKNKSLAACHDYIFAKYWGENAQFEKPDIVIIDHGRNDFIPTSANDSGEDVNVIPENPYDRTTSVGALNFIVKTILEHDNKVKIMQVGHYDDHESDRLIKAQETVAHHWQFPFLRSWEKTGFTLNKISTDGYWDGATSQKIWIEHGNPEGFRDLPMINIWLPDGVHPGNDAAGKANYYLSDIIGGWLKNNLV